MSEWICRDGTKIKVSSMYKRHLFYAYKKFVPHNIKRTALLLSEFKRRNLPLPKEGQNLIEYLKTINSSKVLKRLGLI